MMEYSQICFRCQRCFMLRSYSTVFKWFKRTRLIIKAPSGAPFCSLTRRSCHRMLSPPSGHVRTSDVAKPINKGLFGVFVFFFFRTSFCPMTDDDQHIQETQLKVFVRCMEDTPKQRRRKHNRLGAWPAHFNASKAKPSCGFSSVWMDEFCKRCGTR